jgi:SAM-dependent methyltransferase
MPGVHSRFLEFFKGRSEPANQSVLDLGAGEGALTQKLYEMGFDVQACDLFPEYFKFDRVKFTNVDVTRKFPYPDQSFDLVIAVEVTEHILDHENFFSEIYRILKPGGKLYVSTPNILSMKSRIRFLYRGFPYAFNPLEMKNYDGLQHVASLTPDQYNYIAVKYHFHPAEYDIDRSQSTSKWLYAFLFPFIWLNQRIKGFEPIHNQKKLLMGRLLFLIFKKPVA